MLSNHLVVEHGRVIGGWRRIAEKGAVVVETRLLTTFDRTSEQALDAAVERYARFLGASVTWRKRKA